MYFSILARPACPSEPPCGPGEGLLKLTTTTNCQVTHLADEAQQTSHPELSLSLEARHHLIEFLNPLHEHPCMHAVFNNLLGQDENFGPGSNVRTHIIRYLP